MKKLILILTLLITITSYGFEIDTITINSKIKDVNVFFDGAQITRQAKITLSKGKHLLVIDRLPAEINPQSIQVNNNQKGEILSVKHELSYPSDKNETVIEYDKKIETEKFRIQEIINEINVFDIEEKILLDNSVFGNKTEGNSITEIKEAATFYRAKLNEIRKEKLKLGNELDSTKEHIKDLYLELNEKVSQELKTYSKVSIILDCETAVNSNFEMSYYVPSAGWNPLYDFRVNSINTPLNIIYNANIYQSTGESWENVNLTLSTNTPSLNNNKPELEPWFINRKKSVPQKTIILGGQSAIKGVVTDQQTGEVLPFVKITVSRYGKIIAHSKTDFDGRYNIKPIQSGQCEIQISFIGYKSLKTNRITLNPDKLTTQNFAMMPNAELLSVVEVTSYKKPLIDKDGGAATVTITKEDISRMPQRRSSPIASTSRDVISLNNLSENLRGLTSSGYEANTTITSLEYKIDIPYSIPSDGKDYTVRIKHITLPVEYEYYAIPKLDKDVFLVTKIKDWAQLNLLSGNTSVYYKGIFTGQSAIDANSTKDTLTLSLNRDQNIIVERTQLKEKNKKQLIGKNIKETINWSITVKNNKNVRAKIIVEDQFPISELKSIEIEKMESSNGKINDKTGQVIWELELEPNEKRELILQYSVKYPNYINSNWD